MNKENIYKRSLELAREYIQNTPGDLLKEEIKHYKESGIKGPTFDEYLDILQSELQTTQFYSSIYEFVKFDNPNTLLYNLPNAFVYTSPAPPSPQAVGKPRKTKKDSEIVSESFFS